MLIMSLQEGVKKKLEKQTTEAKWIWPEILVVGLRQTLSCVIHLYVSSCCSSYFLSVIAFWDRFFYEKPDFKLVIHLIKLLEMYILVSSVWPDCHMGFSSSPFQTKQN